MIVGLEVQGGGVRSKRDTFPAPCEGGGSIFYSDCVTLGEFYRCKEWQTFRRVAYMALQRPDFRRPIERAITVVG